ncbi:LysR substrate binding domain-containing protein [Nannocystis exedens]|uniref:LysR substrate binding domain-containing protein n=1 Tax=Nannocystis exedens TaxID=54 RepID=A0A1I2J0Z4_9BACT|nr:LysR substrate-binding domain-containing protein [Nannocystis exedens]PCC74140.1 LysR substrate binding domain protein [Nannocystis exedens]SFF48144.1 LysR substrate binding domain-containing protein [Nannocystis exedens]
MMFRRSRKGARRFIVAGRPHPVALRPVLATNSTDATIAHAELEVVLVEFEPPPQPIHLVYPSARLVSAKVRAFVDLVLETCDWSFVAL